jgi:hypothetical protein
MLFKSKKLRKWVTDYVTPRLADGWWIEKIDTFTAGKKRNGNWSVFVQLDCSSYYTVGHLEFDKYGNYVGGQFIQQDKCFKIDKIDLLMQHLGLTYVKGEHTSDKIVDNVIKVPVEPLVTMKEFEFFSSSVKEALYAIRKDIEHIQKRKTARKTVKKTCKNKK